MKTILALGGVTIVTVLCLVILINGLMLSEDDLADYQPDQVGAMDASGPMAPASGED